MGRLIVFEGVDGSGKSTQFKMICDRLQAEQVSFQKIAFPQYAEPSSALIKMYLSGEFGKNPEDVNVYAASAFYAVDRFSSFVKIWREYYVAGGLILSDRYTTSNAIHQGSKLPENKRAEYFKWLYEFEFELMKLPSPDTVIYLDVPADTAIERMRKREAETNTNADIHEADTAYLEKCCLCGRQAADFYNWTQIKSHDGKELRDIEDIHREIYNIVTKK